MKHRRRFDFGWIQFKLFNRGSLAQAERDRICFQLFIFLIIKYFEYSAKYHHGLFPSVAYGSTPNNMGFSPEVIQHYRCFFGLYFCMTGLHGLHVIFGMGLLTWVLTKSRKNRFSPDYFTPVEVGALYWHLVDLIWIYLFPLLYLVG